MKFVVGKSGSPQGRLMLNVPQPSLEELFAAAIQRYQAGDLPKAEGLLRQILRTIRDTPMRWHCLGVIAHRVGRNDMAVDLIRQAVAIAPAGRTFSAISGRFIACRGGPMRPSRPSRGAATEPGSGRGAFQPGHRAAGPTPAGGRDQLLSKRCCV